ncbi:MAG: PD40 domain-containing protein [Anaerolineae bacterium]|nr:PD40 domain-containing protein [Anaerolineae bacterium]
MKRRNSYLLRAISISIAVLYCTFIPGAVSSQETTTPFTHAAYFGVYRLVATSLREAAEATGAVLSSNIHHARLNLDGDWLAWSSYQRPASTLYFSDFDGSGLTSIALDPALGDLWEFAVGGRQVVFIPSGGESIWAAAEDGAGLLYAATAEIPKIHSLEVTADGAWLYFVVGLGPNQDDIYEMPAALTAPMRMVDNADIPCPAVDHCKSVWTVQDIRVSADGGTLAALISGYFVEDPATGQLIGVDHDEMVILSGAGYRYITDGLPLGRIIGAPSISPDGGTIVFNAEVFEESLTSGVRRWVASDTDGAGPLHLLAMQNFNLAEPSLTGDGTRVLLDLSQIAAVTGEEVLMLFPNWGTPIRMAALSNLSLSRDGSRLAFTLANEALYVGAINDPQVLAEAPIGIIDIAVEVETAETFTITVTTEGPVRMMSLDAVQDGVIITDEAARPVKCSGGLHDDAVAPDAAAGDGIFTARCNRRVDGQLMLRIGAGTIQQGWVIVADISVT